jgi:predicted LPLAT superfamily acyltransferase
MYEKRRQRGDRSPWLKPLAQRYDMSVSALEHVVRRATYRWVE